MFFKKIIMGVAKDLFPKDSGENKENMFEISDLEKKHALVSSFDELDNMINSLKNMDYKGIIINKIISRLKIMKEYKLSHEGKNTSKKVSLIISSDVKKTE